MLCGLPRIHSHHPVDPHTLTGQLVCARPWKGAKVKELRLALSLNTGPEQGGNGSAWGYQGGLAGEGVLEVGPKRLMAFVIWTEGEGHSWQWR